MPITDIGSYVTTGQEFEVHLADVNADRVANGLPEFAWPDGYVAAGLSADIADVAAAITSQESLDNALSIATNGRDSQRDALRDRVIDFRKILDYRLKDSVYSTSMPDTPQRGSSEQKFLRALDDVADLWTRINADTGTPNFTPPLVFSDGYALADLQTDVAALRDQYKSVVEGENDARIGRKKRDALLEPLRDRFVQYRQGIEVEYGEEHPFTESLPDVYPRSNGSPAPDPPPPSPPPPAPLTLSGQWDNAAGDALLTWTVSDIPDLADYELRMSPGASYDPSTAVFVNSFPSDTDPLEFRTTQGLETSGDVASFKVFARDLAGAETGSNTVTITRP